MASKTFCRWLAPHCGPCAGSHCPLSLPGKLGAIGPASKQYLALGSLTCCCPCCAGYDEADNAAVLRAKPGEAVRSLTGRKYCLREGVYSETIPEDLASMPGQPCMRVDSISCVR